MDAEFVCSSGIRLGIAKGCDGLDGMILLVSAIFALRTSWKKQWIGALAGCGFLYAVNLLRIVSLYFLFKYKPALFDPMHSFYWQFIFIACAMIFYLVWMDWAAPVATKKTTSS